ncbi:MAG: phenylalanine--tRNA ligase subunit beta [Pseudomonadota bacterium]
MKFSRNWLETFLDSGEHAQPELNYVLERLTLAGLEVDGHERIQLPDAVVVAKIVNAEQHPNADRLRVCEVSDGDDTYPIVCGAPNARAGIFVALAKIGAKLPGGLKIKISKLRGVASHGMLCSGAELSLGDDHDGILELPELPLGTSLAEVLGAPDDVIDLDLTPNRGDCFSLLGVARETAVSAGVGLREPSIDSVTPSIKDSFDVRIDAPESVPVFSFRVIRDIDPSATTPLWMLERLRRSGIRSIHPVVDITNYVMLELGQPMHAYDLDLLQGDIVVRNAQAEERLDLLDGKEISAAQGSLLITDSSGPIGLAGIMGGASTAVSAATTNIVFEAAFFAQDAMAGEARRYGLHTDASMRFERGVDPDHQVRAQERAAQLLLEICGGSAAEVREYRHHDHLPRRQPVALRSDRLNKVLGTNIDPAFVTQTFVQLGFGVEDTSDGWQVTPASFRFDIEIEEDLIEEVARVFGYDNIPMARAYAQVALAPSTESVIAEERIRDTLVAQGYKEVISYSFVDPEAHKALSAAPAGPTLVNPISSELSVMRGSLIPGLVGAALHNTARQQQHLQLFELGSVFSGDAERQVVSGLLFGTREPEQWARPHAAADFFDIKSTVSSLLTLARASQVHFVPAQMRTLHPGQSATVVIDGVDVGFVGALHPALSAAKDLGGPTFVFELDYAATFGTSLPIALPVPRFPAVRRDIAVLVNEATTVDALLATIREASDNLLSTVRVFDIYRGKGVEAGLKSVAFGLILLDSSRTLTDEDVDKAVAGIAAALETSHGAKLRE